MYIIVSPSRVYQGMVSVIPLACTPCMSSKFHPDHKFQPGSPCAHTAYADMYDLCVRTRSIKFSSMGFSSFVRKA